MTGESIDHSHCHAASGKHITALSQRGSNHMWFLAIVPDPWAINFGEFKDDFPDIAYSNLSGSAAALFAMHAATNAVNRVQG